jgi:hypothetical protein
MCYGLVDKFLSMGNQQYPPLIGNIPPPHNFGKANRLAQPGSQID